MPERRRSTTRDRSMVREAARGIGSIVALGLIICVIAFAIAITFVVVVT